MASSSGQRRRHHAVRAASVVAGLLVIAGTVPATALEGGSREPDRETRVSVQQSAYWTTPAPRTLPETLRQEFPPGVACILNPELCGEEGRTLTEPVEDTLTEVQQEAEPEPVQPVPDGTLPVGVLFGEPRYVSGLKFETPQIPEGQQPSLVELVLDVEVEPTGVNSPAFQKAVGAAIDQVAAMQAGADPSPEPFLDVLANTAQGETEPASELDPPALMVCGAVEPWDEGDNQDADAMPGTEHCFLGGDGRPLDDGEAWAFDITAAVIAWLDDDLEFGRDNHGVLIMPAPVEALAYGDPDYTTNFLGAFTEADDVAIRFATTETVGDAENEVGGDPAIDGSEATEPVGDTAVGADGGTSVDPDTAEPVEPADEQDATSEPPDVVEAPTQQQPEVPSEGVAQPDAEPQAPWYVWLLLPLAAGGAWWYSRVHDMAVPAGLGESEETGAMTRLVQWRHDGG